MISHYPVILLDIDGVILSSVDYYTQLFRELIETLGGPKTLDDHFYRSKLGDKIEKWIKDLVPENRLKEVRPFFESKHLEPLQQGKFSLVPGAFEALTQFKSQNQLVGLVSTKHRKGIDETLRHFDLEKLVDFSIGGDEVTHFKPHPEGLQKALSFFNVKPNAGVFIGDSLHDSGAAARAGVDFLGVLTGVCSETDWTNAGVKFSQSLVEISSPELKKSGYN